MSHMSTLQVADLCCCQGGVSVGLRSAGFLVDGVDIVPQPRYPFRFFLMDAVEFIHEFGHLYDGFSASPPCQRYSKTQRIQGNEHPDLIGPVRDALIATGKPYMIENVEDARPELRDPVMLCGAQFGLHTYRHRLFETNFPVTVPVHQDHATVNVKMGRPLRDGDFYHAVGNFSGVGYARHDMNVGWMNRDGIRECVPPIYTRYLGLQMAAYMKERAAA